jgi:release factor glutamine methyltransferase
MSNLAERLALAADALDAVTDTPRLDAELLMAHALGMPRAKLLARLQDTCEVPGFEDLAKRRLSHEPIAYIIGEWEFFSLQLTVKPPIFVPRPETEHLVEAVLSVVANARARILDIGTGTGCVAIAIAHNAPMGRVVATDINPAALQLASANAARHGLSDAITFREGDLFQAVREHDFPFDAICSNPPYVKDGDWETLPPVIQRHEDPLALLAGPDGLNLIRRLVFEATAYLVPGGLLAFEIGIGQYDSVRELLLENNYADVVAHRDLAGIERVVAARKPMR